MTGKTDDGKTAESLQETSDFTTGTWPIYLAFYCFC